MLKEIILLLLTTTPITIGDFEFCKKYDGWHTINIQDDIISNNKIEICKSARDKEFALAHELGHQYWHLGISVWEREAYRKLFTTETYFYRDYSKTSVIEDFSDNFALIVLKRAPDNRKIDFIKKTFK